ncbi:hypothetical protein MTR_0012s0070 [Medicago truncatula]|uniref:Uncharacterized protein n=1 Tax=Medicago truncatula TaxID=3880 RepID=A0A072TJY5_MEDTR|nr:hypothetical protein MTR_0012s0070 [Medicago truncatula]
MFLDASAGGSLRIKTDHEVQTLIENMASNEYRAEAKNIERGVFGVSDTTSILANQAAMNKQIETLTKAIHAYQLSNKQQAAAIRCDLCGEGHPNDEELGTVVGKIISGKTLRSMKLIKNLITSEEDLTVETVQSDLMTDFPSISKEDNPEVLYQFIKAHFNETGQIISLASIPEKIGGAPLKVKGKRSSKAEKETAPAPKPKRAKTVKAEGSTVSASDEVIQKKRNKEPEVQDAAREAALHEEVARREAAIREEAIRRKRAKGERSVQERIKEAPEQSKREEEELSLKKAKKPV